MYKKQSSIGLALAIISAIVFATTSGSQQPQSRPDRIFTMALTGDSIITRHLSPYKEADYLRMVDLIRNTDAGFTNLEMLLHDYEGYPQAQSGGVWLRADPSIAKELAWAGIKMVARANNHAGDYSPESMRSTSKYLDQAGIVHAGVGENLQQAREAHYLETANGRVALVSCASTFTPQSIAGKQRSDVGGRPGLNPLRFDTRYLVDQATVDNLKKALMEIGLPAGDQATQVRFMDNLFVAGTENRIEQTPNAQDLREITDSIKDARRQADYVVVTIHAHEDGKNRQIPADFLPKFAHAAIDAGADVFVGHGPHVLRGIEIYKGKPIFYSLGDFIFQNETVLRLPGDNYEALGLGPEARVDDFNAKRYDNDNSGFPADRLVWESVIAVPAFKGAKLSELKLYPISLGFGQPIAWRGRPMLANSELSKKIIDDLIQLSEPFGTKIDYKDSVGIVDIQ